MFIERAVRKDGLFCYIYSMKKSINIKRMDVIKLRNAYNNYVAHLSQEIYCFYKPNDNKNPSAKELQENGNQRRAAIAEILEQLKLT